MRKTDPCRGQVLPVLLAIILVITTVIALTQRTTQALGTETTLVNAADAAAYSGAVWTARRLNLMAYTNRAMIANHIAVGHLVAYISWLRYVDQAVDRISRFARYIPYIGAAVESGRRTVRGARTAMEKTSGGLIKGLDALTDLMSAAQLDMRREIMPWHLNAVMQAVVEETDNAFKVNDIKAAGAVPAPYGTGLQGLLASWWATSVRRIETGRPSRNDDAFNHLLARTIDEDRQLSRWLRGRISSRTPRYGTGGRTWSESLFNVVRFRKQGPTNQAPLPSAGGWRSADRLQVSFFDLGKLRWRSWGTVASGQASADALAGDYRGIKRYQTLTNATKSPYQFLIPAVVTTGADPEQDAGLHAHLSTGEVAYRLPSSCRDDRRCPSRTAPATLFNPYWEARLAPVSLKDFS
ncbi:hypothetical protein BB931_06855 [Spiribacter salinus]|nr:hypothetical protein [Spiribacter salinus]